MGRMGSCARWSVTGPVTLHGEQVSYYPDGAVAEREVR